MSLRALWKSSKDQLHANLIYVDATERFLDKAGKM